MPRSFAGKAAKGLTPFGRHVAKLQLDRSGLKSYGFGFRVEVYVNLLRFA